MFEGIHFEKSKTEKQLTSKKISYEDALKRGYNVKAIANANFSLSGSVDAFPKPPVSDFATEHLYYMEDFDRFYYQKHSYTERWNFNSFMIGYTYSGTGLLRYGEKEYMLSKGDGFYINCNHYHYYEAVSDVWDIAVLHLGGSLLSCHHSQFMQYASPVFHEPLSGNVQEYLEALLGLYSQPVLNRDWLASSCIDTLLNHLLKTKGNEAVKDSALPKNIRYLIKYMDSNFTQPLTLDFLSDFAGVSKYYLSREFKKYTGFSPNDYLITLRINKAKSLLTNTTLPAVKIAHKVGIYDSNNFTNLFKRKTGMTPIQYRNCH